MFRARAAGALIALALGSAAFVFAPLSRASAAGGPFACAPGFYQVISGQLKELNPVTGVYTDIGSAQPTYNAMGYDVADNYLYAISTDSTTQAHLLKIAADGSVTDLGVPTGLPVASYVAGDFDGSGHLLLRSSATSWYSVDVATVKATAFTVSGAADTGNDIVWVGGVAYMLSGTTLYAVDLSTDVATSATVSGIVSGSFGAGWSDNPNDLFFSDNNTGHIYQITGFTGSSPSGTLKVTGAVTSNNDGAACKLADNPFDNPTANADSYSVTGGDTLSVNQANGVLANDVGAGLSVSSNTAPSNGTLVMNADGSFTYTPDSGFSGADQFTYVATDQYGRDSSPATVTITVNLPAAPAANDDSYSTQADVALGVAAPGVLGNDTGTGIAVTSHTAAANGIAVVKFNGLLQYFPDSGYSGPDSFTYTITDAYARSATATVTVTVDPVAADVTGAGIGPAPLQVTPPAPVGTGPFTYALASTPPSADGTASIDPSTGVITFTPASGFSGAVPTFTYTVMDVDGDLSNAATIDLTIKQPAAPAANDDSYSTQADVSLGVPAPGVLSNDTGTGTTVTSHTAPSNGTVTVKPSGAFAYDPDSGYSGPDSFTYTITDAYSRTATATVTVTVDPVAADVTGAGTGPAPLQVTPSSPVGTGPFTYALASTPPSSDGTASIDPTTGVITFTPASGFSGAVPTFTYTVMDVDGDVSNAANIDLTIEQPAAPAAADVAGTTPAGHALSLTPATPSGAGPFTFALATVPPSAAGTASMDASTGVITFTPAAGFSGIVPVFTYTVSDQYGRLSAPATVAIDVTPLARPASAHGKAGAPITVTPPPPTGTGPFTYALVPSSLPPSADGRVTINQVTGAVTFTPAAGFSGTVNVEYTVTDGDGLVSPPADVTFDVAAASTPPTPPTPKTGMPAPGLAALGTWLLLAGLLLVAACAHGIRRTL